MTAIARCIKLSPSEELFRRKVLVYVQLNNIIAARNAFKVMLSKYPDEEHFAIEFADAVLVRGFTDLAIALYIRYVLFLLGTAQLNMNLLTSVSGLKLILSRNRSTYDQQCSAKSSSYILEHLSHLLRAVQQTTDLLYGEIDLCWAVLSICLSIYLPKMIQRPSIE